MVEFKVVISDPKSGHSYTREVSGPHANALVGKRLKEEVDGIFVDLPGYKLQITGGSDKDGFPMRSDLPGPRVATSLRVMASVKVLPQPLASMSTSCRLSARVW